MLLFLLPVVICPEIYKKVYLFCCKICMPDFSNLRVICKNEYFKAFATNICDVAIPWPYKCFFLICLVCLFKWKCTSGYVTVNIILIFKTVLMSPSFQWGFIIGRFFLQPGFCCRLSDVILSFEFSFFFFFLRKMYVSAYVRFPILLVKCVWKPYQINAWAFVTSVAQLFGLCFGFP